MAEICSVNVRYKTVICFLFIHSRIHSVSKSERTDKQIISNLRLPKVWSCTWWESNLGVCLWFAIAFLKKMAEARKIAWIIWTIKLIWNIMKLDLVLFDLVLFSIASHMTVLQKTYYFEYGFSKYDWIGGCTSS